MQEFAVLIAVVMKSAIFWEITPSSLIGVLFDPEDVRIDHDFLRREG
jgi:hypothetical protein